MCYLKQPVGERRFTVIDMGYDTEVARAADFRRRERHKKERLITWARHPGRHSPVPLAKPRRPLAVSRREYTK
jgi:hypothetical protein